MLMEVKKHSKLIWSYFKFNLSASMEYRVNFLVQTFGMMINNLAFIFFWWILFDNVPSIGGYGFNDVAILWAFSSASFGLSFIFFGNIRSLSTIIVNGELDSYLLQPKDVLINVISSKTVISAWGDLFYGLILFLVIDGLSLNFILFIFLVITSSLIFSSALIATHSLTFYMGNADGIADLFLQFILNFTTYPEGVFNNIVKFIMYTVLPAGFIAFIPLTLIKSFSLKAFIILLVATVIWVNLAFLIFKRGLKRYESGNLISNKI